MLRDRRSKLKPHDVVPVISPGHLGIFYYTVSIDRYLKIYTPRSSNVNGMCHIHVLGTSEAQQSILSHVVGNTNTNHRIQPELTALKYGLGRESEI